MNNRRRGHNYERQIVKELKEIGFEGIVTSRAESKNMDDRGVDIFDLNQTSTTMPFYVQCKLSTKNIAYDELLASEKLPKDKPLIIFHKKAEKANTNFTVKGEYVILNKKDFYNLYYGNDNTGNITE